MSKNCLDCIYYLKKTGYCVLLARKVADPKDPPCEKIIPNRKKTQTIASETTTDNPSAQKALATLQRPQKVSRGGKRLKTIEKVELEYASTGIRELDEVLGGGFIRGKTYLVAGETGSGKTIFSIQFLLSGVTKFNEPGVYVAIDEPTEQLIKGLKRFGWDVTPLIKEGILKFLDMRTHFSKVYLTGERRKIEPRFIIESILKAAKKIGAKRLVIDPIAPLIYGGSKDDVLYVREFLREMVFAIERVGTITTIMTSEIPTGSKLLSRFGVEEFLALSLIHI